MQPLARYCAGQGALPLKKTIHVKNMLTIYSLAPAPGELDEVFRVAGEGEMSGYYFRMGGVFYSTRLCSTAKGPALRRLRELPSGAEPEILSEDLIGAEVRRVLLCWRKDDEPELVLDMGRERFLRFYPIEEEVQAAHLKTDAECGAVEVELKISAILPESVKLASSDRQRMRLGGRLLACSVALLLSAVVCGVVGLTSVLLPLLLGAFGFFGGAGALLRRRTVCPFCGQREWRVHSVTSSAVFYCDSCGNFLIEKRR